MTKYTYTSDDVIQLLGGLPNQDEVKRLVEQYEKYSLPRRAAIITGILDGKGPVAIANDKIKGIEGVISKQAKGGHVSWATSKTQRLIIRVLYLRSRIDNNLSRRKANAEILKKIPELTSTSFENLQSKIRKHTLGALIDNQ